MVAHRFSSIERWGWSEMNLGMEVGEGEGVSFREQQNGVIFPRPFFLCLLFFSP